MRQGPLRSTGTIKSKREIRGTPECAFHLRNYDPGHSRISVALLIHVKASCPPFLPHILHIAISGAKLSQGKIRHQKYTAVMHELRPVQSRSRRRNIHLAHMQTEILDFVLVVYVTIASLAASLVY